MQITASCRHIDAVLNDHTVALVESLKTECGCTEQAIQTFRDCMYRHGGSIIKYAHNVLRCNNHDDNTQSVVTMLIGGDESKREHVHALVRQYMDTVCEYTDSYEY
jgi:hypothetical protein